MFAKRNGPHSTPALTDKVDKAHNDLRIWLGQLELPGVGEQHRLQSMSMITAARSALRDAAKELNKGLPPPECPSDQIWRPQKGICEPRCHHLAPNPGSKYVWKEPGSAECSALDTEGCCVLVLDQVDLCGKAGGHATEAECVAYYTTELPGCPLLTEAQARATCREQFLP